MNRQLRMSPASSAACRLSVEINKRETPHSAKIRDAFCLRLFPRVWFDAAKTRIPTIKELHADDAIKRAVKEVRLLKSVIDSYQ